LSICARFVLIVVLQATLHIAHQIRAFLRDSKGLSQVKAPHNAQIPQGANIVRSSRAWSAASFLSIAFIRVLLTCMFLFNCCTHFSQFFLAVSCINFCILCLRFTSHSFVAQDFTSQVTVKRLKCLSTSLFTSCISLRESHSHLLDFVNNSLTLFTTCDCQGTSARSFLRNCKISSTSETLYFHGILFITLVKSSLFFFASVSSFFIICSLFQDILFLSRYCDTLKFSTHSVLSC